MVRWNWQLSYGQKGSHQSSKTCELTIEKDLAREVITLVYDQDAGFDPIDPAEMVLERKMSNVWYFQEVTFITKDIRTVNNEIISIIIVVHCTLNKSLFIYNFTLKFEMNTY